MFLIISEIYLFLFRTHVVLALQKYIFLFAILLQICLEITLIIELQFFIETTKKHATRLQIIRSNFADKR